MVIAAAVETGEKIEKFVYFVIDGGQIREREEVNTAPGALDQFTAQLNSLKVDLLIAGDISREMELALFDAGINLISGIKVDADKTVADYLKGDLNF